MIRPAELSDVTWMAQCHWDAYREHTTEEYLKSTFNTYIDLTVSDVISRIVYVDSELRGYIVVDLGSTEVLKDEYNCAYIKRVYVKPEHRGLGICKELIKVVKENHNCSVLQVLTDEEYAKLGGKKVGVLCLV